MRVKRPTITRRWTGPDYRTPLQRRLADRELVILACHLQGLSVRLIASALGLDPSYVSRTLDAIEERAIKSTPEDSPESL
jgi:DNA-binding MarR family transcriptional regulator